VAEKNIRLDLQYNGTGFSGWQYQPNAVTIQREVENAVERVTAQKVTLYAAGRTDAGVHALGQVVNFRIDHDLPPHRFKDAVNFYLPRTILVTRSCEVPPEFHARKSAKWRQYRYLISLERSALYYDYRWEYDYPLGVEKMNEIAQYIKGTHDFAAFCTISSQKDNNECNVISSGWKREGTLLTYEIRANRFLRTMVRSLVGAMVASGNEKEGLTLENFKDILQSKDHTRLKTVAPARGLYLMAVGY
jgi:tRNA pseudouridine38-40 synthase